MILKLSGLPRQVLMCHVIYTVVIVTIKALPVSLIPIIQN